MFKLKNIRVGCLTLFLAMMMPSYATNEDIERRALINQLKKLSLKELIEVEFFNPKGGLAARKVQKLTQTAAALFVITQEDIRRAGITRIPEALRMVPGVQVARVSANKWAISARGFNGLYASKLLVMIDGRTVYTPLRSEVFWDVQDTLIENVERIEVIRGPGSSLWGANAVNGVINIVTKSAKKTQGSLVTTYLGQGEERAIVGVRQGGQLNNDIYYRVYGKFFEHDHFVNEQGEAQQDNWQMKQGGFRMDWGASEQDNLTVQGDIYHGFVKQNISVFQEKQNDFVDLNGLNLLARWQHDFSNGDIRLQTYYDHTRRDRLILDEIRDTYDLDFQHRWQPNEKQEFIWGLGFRYSKDEMDNTFILTYIPKKRQDKLFSAFVRSEFKIAGESKQPGYKSTGDLRLIIGSKFEHNDYSGFEIQPTIRLLWKQSDKQILWAAISRAVRTPSRSDSDIEYNTLSDAGIIRIIGNHDFQSEELLAYELGYRFNPNCRFLLDISLFYNKYDKLRTGEPIDFISTPPTIIIKPDNQMFGEVYGLELSASWEILKRWKMIATYSYSDIQLHLNPTSRYFVKEMEEDDTPHHQATLRSLFTLPNNLELDTALYYVDNVSNQNVPHYTRFDIRLGWHAWKNMELSLGARNLFNKHHREFGNGNSISTIRANEVRQAIYMQLKYRF
ncbi:MAG: TonB-dependent receptor [Thiomargarita sp.]|nr:TonB-dependent receptor [Thiomargarita sp.]